MSVLCWMGDIALAEERIHMYVRVRQGLVAAISPAWSFVINEHWGVFLIAYKMCLIRSSLYLGINFSRTREHNTRMPLTKKRGTSILTPLVFVHLAPNSIYWLVNNNWYLDLKSRKSRILGDEPANGHYLRAPGLIWSHPHIFFDAQKYTARQNQIERPRERLNEVKSCILREKIVTP